MHHHLEIIMPPVANVAQAIEQILTPFDESGRDEDGEPNRHTFWDWYVIGGRWAGDKVRQSYDKDKLDTFHAALQEREVTVSGLQAGKQELDPASQIPMVDALWCEHFPDAATKVCPLFAHYNDQYQNSDGFPDIMPLKDMPPGLTASHVIIAGPSFLDEQILKAEYMVQHQLWNGVTFQKSAWDGKVRSAIDEHIARLKNYKDEYAAKMTPTENWLVVTVDYHS